MLRKFSILFWLIFCLTIYPSFSHAAAWVQEKGKSFFSLQLYYYQTEDAFDSDGNKEKRGGVFRKTEINQRAQFLAQLQDRAFGTTDFQEIFRKLEYGQVNVDPEFHGSKEQTQMVSLLSFFEFISQLEKMGLIKFQDVKEIFGYYILRIYQSQPVIDYRRFLKEWVKQGKYPENVTFPNFEALAKRIEKSGTSPNMESVGVVQ